MTLSETRKSWLSTNFFPNGLITSSSVMNAIVSDLNNTSDADIADISWMYQSIGTTYSSIASDYEDTGVITEIVSGKSFKVLLDCPLGQVCDLTPISVTLEGVSTGNYESEAKAWLSLHLPVGSSISISKISDGEYLASKGNENINESLLTYIANLALVTPATGAEIQAMVISITDGDTFEAQQVCPAGQLCVVTPFTVRLSGVSASELTFQSGRTAKTWLADHIPPGTVVTLSIKGSDPYGRQVCIVYYNGTNINDLMILSGQGESYNPEAESFQAKQIGIQLSGCKSNNAPVSTLATLEMVGPVCNYIKSPPNKTWFGYQVRNVGTKSWKGWLGVIVHGSAGNYEYTGSTQYQTTVPANGSTVTLWAKFVVPTNVGNVTHWDAIINSND
mgnify:CR=1 FL=1